MNNEILKTSIEGVIKANGNQEITGPVLQQSLLSIINQFGGGGVFAGIAVPDTVPKNSDLNQFYIANANGIYVNFGGYKNEDNNLVVFGNNTGIWENVASFPITNTQYIIDPSQIVPTEAMYTDGTLATSVRKRVDLEFDNDVNLVLSNEWYDGSPITDARVDNEVFFKIENDYYIRAVDRKEVLNIDTISDLRNFNAYYIGQEVNLMGYAATGDKVPSVYKFFLNQGVDNGGTIVNTNIGRWVLQLNKPLNVDIFGAKGDGITNDSTAIQKAFDTKLDIEFTSGKSYLMSTKVYLPAKTFYVERMNYVFGNGATIICDLVDDAIFNGAQGSGIFSSKITWKDLNITQKNTPTSTTNKCQAFNLDKLYNTYFNNLSFKAIHTCFKSVNYIQSVDISKCHFTGVYYQILANRCYNTTFSNNLNESCVLGVVISSTGDPDVNTLRVTNNVFEGGNIPQITIGSTYGCEIKNNYFEGNIGDSEIVLNSPASPYRGLNISGNTFQPTVLQNNSGTYCPIKRVVINTFISGSNPQIIGNSTTGDKIINDLRNCFYDGNFELKDRVANKFQKDHNVQQVFEKWQAGNLKSNIANFVAPDYKLFDLVFANDGYYTIELKGSLYFLTSNGTELGRAYLSSNIVLVKKGADIRKKVIDFVCKNVTITKADNNPSINFINETSFGLTVNSENTFSFQGFTQGTGVNIVNSTVFEGAIMVKSRVYSTFDMIIL